MAIARRPGISGQEMSMKYRKITLRLVVALMLCTSSVAWSGENGTSAIKVYGFVFEGVGKVGDFNWMIRQPEFKDVLFVFNDNTEQFDDHLRHPNSGPGCEAGGNNAVIRPYQCENPPRALGMPTGPGFDRLSPEVKAYIDKATNQITATVKSHGYTRVFYNAADASGGLGTRIFSVGDDVKDYIVAQLRTLATN
jgi:hypothetical protein